MIPSSLGLCSFAFLLPATVGPTCQNFQNSRVRVKIANWALIATGLPYMPTSGCLDGISSQKLVYLGTICFISGIKKNGHEIRTFICGNFRIKAI